MSLFKILTKLFHITILDLLRYCSFIICRDVSGLGGGALFLGGTRRCVNCFAFASPVLICVGCEQLHFGAGLNLVVWQ